MGMKIIIICTYCINNITNLHDAGFAGLHLLNNFYRGYISRLLNWSAFTELDYKVLYQFIKGW